MNSKNIQRLLFLLLFVTIIFIKVYLLLIYETLFLISFEYLNSNKKYLKITSHKLYNWVFVSFLAFIVLVRADLFNFSETIDFHINSVEHLFFSCIICLLLSIYMQIFDFLSQSRITKLIVIFVAFNTIGFLNEYFQNFFQQTPIFYLKEDDIKDIVINLIGSTIFLIVSLFYKMKN